MKIDIYMHHRRLLFCVWCHRFKNHFDATQVHFRLDSNGLRDLVGKDTQNKASSINHWQKVTISRGYSFIYLYVSCGCLAASVSGGAVCAADAVPRYHEVGTHFTDLWRMTGRVNPPGVNSTDDRVWTQDPKILSLICEARLKVLMTMHHIAHVRLHHHGGPVTFVQALCGSSSQTNTRPSKFHIKETSFCALSRWDTIQFLMKTYLPQNPKDSDSKMNAD